MKSFMYISSKHITVVGYSAGKRGATIKKHLEVEIPEGVVFNGKITDPVVLGEIIREVKAGNPRLFKQLSLLVDGSFVVTKNVKLPKLKPLQIKKQLKDEFADVEEKVGELISDYSLTANESVNEDGTKNYLAYAVEREVYNQYLAFFQENGVKIANFAILHEALVGYIQAHPTMRDEVCVVNILDGNIMLSLVFNKGKNIFSSRTRLYFETTQDLARVLDENLSGLRQFAISDRLGAISTSTYIGISEEALEELRRYMNENEEEKIEKTDLLLMAKVTAKDFVPDNHIEVLGAAVSNSSINFIKADKEMKKALKIPVVKKTTALVAALLVIAMLAFSAFTLDLINAADMRINELDSYLRRAENTETIKHLSGLSDTTAKLDAVIFAIEDKLAIDDSYAKLTSEIMDFFTTTQTESIELLDLQFDGITGVVSTSGTANTEVDSAKFVETLLASQWVDSVRYTGYDFDEAQGNYQFSIEITLTPNDPELFEEVNE